MGDLVKLCELEELEEGRMLYREVLGCDYLIVKRDGQVYVLDAMCTNDWARLTDGTLDGDIVTCPQDGGQFNIKTGAVVKEPPTYPLDTYEVTVKGNGVYADVTGY